jgi:hypothetical protein
MVKSRAGVEAIAEAEGESEREEERVEEDFSTATTSEGIRSCPRGTAASGGVWSPPRHRTRCHTNVRWWPAQAIKRRLWLTIGPRLHFVFLKIFNQSILKFESVTSPMFKILEIL